MIRLGTHYLEPRRLGFFVAEEAALTVAFLVAASAAATLLGHPAAPGRLLAEALLVGLLAQAALSLADLHDLRVALEDAASGRRLLHVLGALLLVAGTALALRPLAGDPASALAGLSAGCLALVGARAALPALARRVSLHDRVFLVGEGQAARRLLREVSREGRVEVVGFCGPRSTDLAAKARAASANVVVVATDDRRGMPIDELLRCRTDGLEVMEAAQFAARALQRLPVDLVKPADLVYGGGFERPVWVRIGRRAISVGAALALLILTAPLLALVAIAIKLDSDGPVLFRQVRTGLGGRPFEMLKLRTMTVGAEAAGAAWAREGDPRVTRVGKWLRRFRVDELPQLINVLRGEMELVGPRPERSEFCAVLAKKIPYFDLRTLVPPGITGWAQVRYPYAASVEEAREKLQY